MKLLLSLMVVACVKAFVLWMLNYLLDNNKKNVIEGVCT
jgi:hypothetical protein